MAKRIDTISSTRKLESIAKNQAIKDMLLEERKYNESFDKLMKTSGMNNPGFNRSSYKSIIK